VDDTENVDHTMVVVVHETVVEKYEKVHAVMVSHRVEEVGEREANKEKEVLGDYDEGWRGHAEDHVEEDHVEEDHAEDHEVEDHEVEEGHVE